MTYTPAVPKSEREAHAAEFTQNETAPFAWALAQGGRIAYPAPVNTGEVSGAVVVQPITPRDDGYQFVHITVTDNVSHQTTGVSITAEQWEIIVATVHAGIPAPGPHCAMSKTCREPVTHIGSRGYIYCHKHAVARRSNGSEHTRKMTTAELALVKDGKPVPNYYVPLKGAAQ